MLSKESIDKIKKILTLVKENSDYQQYLTKNQNQKLSTLIETRSFYKTAKKCKIKQETLREMLLSKDGILNRLQKAYECFNEVV